MTKRNFSYGARKSARAESVTIDEKKCAIAKLVREIEFQGITGGTCWLRSLTGSIVLEHFDIKHQLVLGGLLYRAGDEPSDIVFFAGLEDNKGHHPGLYHCWLESEGDLIDFSSGDWQAVIESAAELEVEVNPEGLPPITWKYPPPPYIWRPAAPLKAAWQPPPFGPSPGCVWYGPIAEHHPEMLEESKAELKKELEGAVEAVFVKYGVPFVRVFENDSERDAYMKQIWAVNKKATFVLVDDKPKEKAQ
jgi:hypothetical protein